MESIVGSIATPLGEAKLIDLKKLDWLSSAPYTIKILAENILRNIRSEDEAQRILETLSGWRRGVRGEIPFYPARIISQDLTGVSLALDLASLREAISKLGYDPRVVNPVVRVDLIVDHSLQVDKYGSRRALAENMRLEAARNRDKFRLLKWAQRAFENFHVYPPGSGIIHQVNVEKLTNVVNIELRNEEAWIYPDTVLGTDSHTTMVNALGVLGWGIGGIEAELVMLGEPYYVSLPRVIGVRLHGELKRQATATDLALYVTEVLRRKGVVEAIVEFYGESLSTLPVWARLPVANMAPEYGATTGFFPIDYRTLEYLHATGRDEYRIKLVEAYAKRVGLWHDSSEEPEYEEVIDLDLSDVEPSIAGPRNPFERIPLSQAKKITMSILSHQRKRVVVEKTHGSYAIEDGYVALAAIASCTNTGSLDLLVTAGLTAKKAVERGLQVKPWVKTSFTPGSRFAVRVLEELGLIPYLEALRFHVVGYACASCIGNSGPLTAIAEEAAKRGVHLVAVISGNRNFAGRIHPLVKSVYLASPHLVVAYAIAGRIDVDFENEPLDLDPNGDPVYLRDIIPSADEVSREISRVNLRKIAVEVESTQPESTAWSEIDAPISDTYDWKPSFQIVKPPFMEELLEEREIGDIIGARILVMAPDNTTTDHISPAGLIKRESPAGAYLTSIGIDPESLGLTYGSMRGNHEVMIRGAFDSGGFRNLISEKPGSWTKVWPEGFEATVYDASRIYRDRGVSVVIVAGRNYGMGSSRDWAARAPRLLGVRAVIAESFERIHRRNLVALGILPVEVSTRLIDVLRGDEEVDILGLSGELTPGREVKLVFRRSDGWRLEVTGRIRLDTWAEVEYYRSGGAFRYIMRKIIEKSGGEKL